MAHKRTPVRKTSARRAARKAAAPNTRASLAGLKIYAPAEPPRTIPLDAFAGLFR